jgi:hypothetical protein
MRTDEIGFGMTDVKGLAVNDAEFIVRLLANDEFERALAVSKLLTTFIELAMEERGVPVPPRNPVLADQAPKGPTAQQRATTILVK